MRKLLLILLGLFTFAGASQKVLTFTFMDTQNGKNRSFAYDITKPLLEANSKIYETPTEYKTLAKKEEEEDLYIEYTCSLHPSLWTKEDVIIAQQQRKIILKNVPVMVSTFRYHAI